MNHSLHRILLCASALGLGLTITACGDDADDSAASQTAPSTVGLTLSEYKMENDTSRAAAGTVTITAANKGGVEHEVIVIRSDSKADALEVVDGRVPEDAVDVIDEIPEFEPGTTESKDFELTAGHYVIFCNIAGHYTGGMRFELDVI